MLVISNRPRATRSADLKSSPDYSLNCTPLSPITITNLYANVPRAKRHSYRRHLLLHNDRVWLREM